MGRDISAIYDKMNEILVHVKINGKHIIFDPGTTKEGIAMNIQKEVDLLQYKNDQLIDIITKQAEEIRKLKGDGNE